MIRGMFERSENRLDVEYLISERLDWVLETNETVSEPSELLKNRILEKSENSVINMLCVIWILTLPDLHKLLAILDKLRASW